jgi:hypothetical protein
MPRSGAELPGLVPASVGIFHQQDLTSAKTADLTVACLNFNFSIEQHDPLAAWRLVPVEVVARSGLAKDQSAARLPLRQTPDLTGVQQGDLGDPKVGNAGLVGKDASDLHAESIARKPLDAYCAERLAAMRGRHGGLKLEVGIWNLEFGIWNLVVGSLSLGVGGWNFGWCNA